MNLIEHFINGKITNIDFSYNEYGKTHII